MTTFAQPAAALTFPLEDTRMTGRTPVDTGQLWKWVDRLTVSRRHRLVRKGASGRNVVEYVKVPSLWTQLRVAVASSNSGGGRGKSSTGSRSPLDLPKLALMHQIEQDVLAGLAEYGQAPRVVDQGDGHLTVDVRAELRHLAATVVSSGDQAAVLGWTITYRSWVSRAETELTEDDESIDLRGVRGEACPCCLALWVTSDRDGEDFRDPALVIAFRDGQVQHITCRACRAGWWRGEDVDELTRLIATNTAVHGPAHLWGQTVRRAEA